MDEAGETPNTCESDTVRQPIVGGSASPQLLPLTSRENRAVVSISLPSLEPGGERALCTGVVVGPRAVLTARHCVDRDADGIWDERSSADSAPTLVVLGSPDDPDVSQGPADDAWLHPELDVALLEVGWLEDPALEATPLAPNAEDLDEAWVGAPVELAGYGLTEFIEPPALRFAIETVARIEPFHVVVDGMGRSGACVGDSGGPLLGRADDGRIRLLGILDDGDLSCVGEDFYTRLDRLADWEPMARLVPADEPGDVPCAGLSEVGTCERGAPCTVRTVELWSMSVRPTVARAAGVRPTRVFVACCARRIPAAASVAMRIASETRLCRALAACPWRWTAERAVIPASHGSMVPVPAVAPEARSRRVASTRKVQFQLRQLVMPRRLNSHRAKR